MATNDPVLHALLDLVQACAQQDDWTLTAVPAYQNALKVLREHTGQRSFAANHK